MTCTNCGKTVQDGFAFCTYCGTAVAGQPSGTAAPAGAPPVGPAATTPPPLATAPTPAQATVPPVPVPPATQPSKAPSPGKTVSLWPKTGTDILCGFVFLFFGAASLAYFGWQLWEIWAPGAGMAAPARSSALTALMDGSPAAFMPNNPGNALFFLYTISLCFAAVGGLLLLVGGLAALVRGQGKKTAYAAVVCMLFCLLFGGLALAAVHRALLPGGFATLTAAFGGLFLKNFWAVYALPIAAVVVVTILLPIKKHAKRRRLAAGQTPRA